MVGPLVCHATGQPEPTIIWKREDGKAFHVKSTKRMGKNYSGAGPGGGQGGHWPPPQYLADQLTLFEPGGQIIPAYYYWPPNVFHLPAPLGYNCLMTA